MLMLLFPLLIYFSGVLGYEELSRRFSDAVEEPNLVIFNSTTKLDTIQFTFQQFNGVPSIRINGSRNSKKADFRLITLRLVEYNDEHPIEKSTSSYDFYQKEAWSAIKVDKFTESFNKRLSNVIRMNLTFTDKDFQYELSVYLTDRSCYHGNYSLDSDSAYVVQKVVGFPYKYTNSMLAVEQVVGSNESGVVTSYINVMDSPYLGSLLINPEGADASLGKISVSNTDYQSFEGFDVPTSNQVKEDAFQKVYVTLGDKQQLKSATFDAKLSINLGNHGNKGMNVGGGGNGFGIPPVKAADFEEADCSSGYQAATLSSCMAGAILFTLLMVLFN